ncbi:MAG: HEAT repeat domain-containing protein [Planctomycetaceae bacterium]|nr:HEAT repeat domain-containing protein [Planctomycetaceae bacterium]
MNSPSASSSSSEDRPQLAGRPEELPPVEPPSAGFIIQLFLIPALIVAAVIGVWALFGKLADNDTNWQQLVSELGSTNEHRRWRAALGLAQVLRNQQIAPDANGVVLAEQPEVAEALASLLRESLSGSDVTDEQIKHQEFLARTMGSLKADDIVLPALTEAMKPERNVEVRKSSLMSLAMIAGRHFESAAGIDAVASADSSSTVQALPEPLAEPTIADDEILNALEEAAQDEDPSIRHLAAFVLGLVSGGEAMDSLKVLLLDNDSLAQANAAVGLCRNGLTDGVPTLIRLIQQGAESVDRADFQKLPETEQQQILQRRQFEEPIILRNAIRAVESVWTKTTPEQQADLKAQLQKLSSDYFAADIRVLAQTVLGRLPKS